MIDIVERLRKGWDDPFQTMADAADEIEQLRSVLDHAGNDIALLRKENERLRQENNHLIQFRGNG